MALTLTVYVNNITTQPIVAGEFGRNYSSEPFRITNGFPVITWEWSEPVVIAPDSESDIESTTFVDQRHYDIRIGDSDNNLEADEFDGNMDTLFESSTTRQYKYRGKPLQRGKTYYGQIKVIDAQNSTSGWKRFSFLYNQQPEITIAAISPSSPSISDDLTLSYTYFDNDDDAEDETFVRWFRNGTNERQFDNQLVIESSNMAYGDTWSADILPHDGYEYGPRYSTNSVSVTTSAPVASNVYILPTNPTDADILRAVYEVTSDEDNRIIRWYVNEVLQSDANDQEYARFSLQDGDEVRFEITPNDGVSSGTLVSSAISTITSSKFVVDDLRVEGQKEPYDLSTTTPTFTWSIHKPVGSVVDYVSILIGTYAGADNVYFTTLNTNITTFQVPTNVLKMGRDYWVSVAVSDTDTFDQYAISHFRISGSCWEEKSNNATGWTIETIFSLADTTDTTFSEEKYQVVRIQDGTRFGEVRIYSDRLAFASTEIMFSDPLSLAEVNSLTIIGQLTNCKVYLNRALVIDATGKMTQASSSRRLEVGTVSQSALAINYKSFFYTTEGFYAPGNSQYANVQFYTCANFQFQEVVGVEGFLSDGENVKVIGVNPHDENQGGAIYQIASGTPAKFSTVNKTFSPINAISLSPDEKYKIFSHARGGTSFYSYLVKNWDTQLVFTDTDSVTPDNANWDLVSNTKNDAFSIDSNGLLIDTSYPSGNI